MDYNSWFEREIWPFWRQMKNEQNLWNQSGHAHQNWFAYISHQTLYLLEFFKPILFLTAMDYSPWFEREIWPFWRQTKKSKISKTIVVMPMHQNWFACISHQLLLAWIYEPILFFDPHGLYPWSARAIWPFWRQTKMSKSLRPEWPCTPKLVCMHFTLTSTCLNFLSWFYFLNPTGLL